MSTRHLTCVVVGGEYKVAQFGQFDGYPSGQGVDILDFLRNKLKRELFFSKLSKTYQPNDEQINHWWVELGHDLKNGNGFVSFDLARKFDENHPSLSRSTGGKILELIQNADDPLPLLLDKEFAADSLFCEWCYVVDFDKGTFEVFKGFNRTQLTEDERFYGMNVDSGYHPVKLSHSFNLNELPTNDEFIATLESQED